jgi:hypothetical protein
MLEKHVKLLFITASLFVAAFIILIASNTFRKMEGKGSLTTPEKKVEYSYVIKNNLLHPFVSKSVLILLTFSESGSKVNEFVIPGKTMTETKASFGSIASAKSLALTIDDLVIGEISFP